MPLETLKMLRPRWAGFGASKRVLNGSKGVSMILRAAARDVR